MASLLRHDVCSTVVYMTGQQPYIIIKRCPKRAMAIAIVAVLGATLLFPIITVG